MKNSPRRRFSELGVALMLGALSFQLTSCGRSPAGAAQAAAPEVEVAIVEQKDIPVYREWIGTLDGMVNAAIRAQVTGYLLTQDYAEGSFVKKGQLLFEIDPRPLQAAADQARGQLAQANGLLAQAHAQYQQAEAQLASAEANQRKTQFDEDRYTPLAKAHAVTQQDLDNAVQNNVSAKAQVKVVTSQVEGGKAQIQAASAAVEAATAALEAANVNLGFTNPRRWRASSVSADTFSSSASSLRASLRGFDRMHLKSGETKTITFRLPSSTLAIWNREMVRVVEPGKYEIQVGACSTDLRLKGELDIR